MVIIITSLSPQRVRYASWWLYAHGGGDWGGGISARERKSRLINTWERLLKYSSFVPSRSARRTVFCPRWAVRCSLVPPRTVSSAVKAVNNLYALGFPLWLQALTLCRVSPQLGINRRAEHSPHAGRIPHMSERLRLPQQVHNQPSAVQFGIKARAGVTTSVPPPGN